MVMRLCVKRLRSLLRNVVGALDEANHARCMAEYVHDHYGLPAPTWRDEVSAWVTGFYLGLKSERRVVGACVQVSSTTFTRSPNFLSSCTMPSHTTQGADSDAQR